MPDIKALVINVKPRSQQQGAAGQWQDLTSSIQAFTRDIETPSIQDGVDVSAIVSGVPTVFARADLFNHALNEIQTIRKDASVGLNQYYVNLVDEWRGLIACIALNNTAIEIRRITLAYSDGKDMKTTENMYEPKGAFGNMLMNDRSLWTEQGKAVTPTGTMTDENIDEAAALFDQLFDPDRIGSLRNFSVNGTQMTAYADEVAERIGFGHKVYSNNTKLEKGSFDEKFAKAVFLHAITNKKNKAEFSLHGKKVSLKIPAATKEQIRKAAHFRKETEQFKQEFQNIPEVEIPGFIILKQDIKNAGPEVLGLGFNSEERRNAAEDHFSVTKLKEENKAEYDRAVGLYDKIFGGIYEQKLSVAEGTTLLALKAQKQIEPRYLQFEVNGRRSSVTSISSNSLLFSRK